MSLMIPFIPSGKQSQIKYLTKTVKKKLTFQQITQSKYLSPEALISVWAV